VLGWRLLFVCWCTLVCLSLNIYYALYFARLSISTGLSSKDRHSSGIIDDENELSTEDRHSCGIPDDEEELWSEDRDSSWIIDDIIYNIRNLEDVTSSVDIPEALHDFVKQPLHMLSIYHR